MTNIDIANGLVFQSLGISKDTFDERLLSQKKVFLLQELGVDMGYSYNWYVRGPYSPDLANYIFNNLDILKEQDLSGYQLSEESCQKIESVNNLASKKPVTINSLASWYELLASVLFIHKLWHKNEDDVFACLKQYKPQYTQEQFDAAVSELKALRCYA